MRSTAAVDNLILWHGAGILGLAWLTVATASMDGFLAKTDYTFSAKPPICTVEHGCDLLMRSNWQLNRPQDLNRPRDSHI
jgi:hypothetical protein